MEVRSYQLPGGGVRLQTQAGVGGGGGLEGAEPLPQLLSDEGHERGQQSQRRGHAVEEHAAEHLSRRTSLMGQQRLHTLLSHTHTHRSRRGWSFFFCGAGLSCSPGRRHRGCGARTSGGLRRPGGAGRLGRPAHTGARCCRAWSRSTGPGGCQEPSGTHTHTHTLSG